MVDWLEYYSLAWEARRKVFTSLMKTEPMLCKVLGEFDTYERHNRLVMVNDTRKMVYDPLDGLNGAEYVKPAMAAILDDMSGDRDLIIEFGAGYGRRLIDAHLAGSKVPMVGIEPTLSGVHLGELLCAHGNIKEEQIRFMLGDFHTTNLPTANKVLIFTSYAVMYQDPFPKDFFERTADLGEHVRWVFVEPDTEWGRCLNKTPNAVVYGLGEGMPIMVVGEK